MYMHSHVVWIAMWWLIEIAAVIIVLTLLALEFRHNPKDHEEPAEPQKKNRAA